VRGLVRVKSFTQAPSDIVAYGPLTDETGTRRFSLTLTGRVKGALLARIDGVTDRATAATLKGTRLYVGRDALPPPATDEYYYADLIGLAVELPDGTAVGTVRAVENFGAGDLLDVTLHGPRRGAAAVVIPFTHATVPVVDLAGGRIVVTPHPGLLEADEEAVAQPPGRARRRRDAGDGPTA
jgi:16S rRNA processing protein RimM